MSGGQRIEILTVRNPDAETRITLYVDGVEFTDYDVVDVDPGAGHMRSDWLGSQAAILAGDYSEAIKAAALAAYKEEEGSSYIEDDEGIALSCYALVPGPSNYCWWSYDGPDDVEQAAAALIAHQAAAHPRQA